MTHSKIEWTKKTWNPTVGCSECSAGCRECYAAKMAYRWAHTEKMNRDYAGLAKKLRQLGVTGKKILKCRNLNQDFHKLCFQFMGVFEELFIFIKLCLVVENLLLTSSKLDFSQKGEPSEQKGCV